MSSNKPKIPTTTTSPKFQLTPTTIKPIIKPILPLQLSTSASSSLSSSSSSSLLVPSQTTPLPEVEIKKVGSPILLLEELGQLELPTYTTIIEPIPLTIPREQLNEPFFSSTLSGLEGKTHKGRGKSKVEAILPKSEVLKSIDQKRLSEQSSKNRKFYKMNELKQFFFLMGEPAPKSKPEMVEKLRQMLDDAKLRLRVEPDEIVE